jgi:hypothetical protein
VVVALDKVVRNQQLPGWLRCAALDSLGRITMSAQVQLNPDETLTAAGKLAIESCNSEAERLKAWEEHEATLDPWERQQYRENRDEGREPPPADARSRRPNRRDTARNRNAPRRRRGNEENWEEERTFGGVEEPVKNPADDVVLATRRRLKHDLGCVRRGLSRDPAKGLRALAQKGASPSLVDQLDAQLDALLKVLDQSDLAPAQLRQTIESGASRISGLLAAGPPPAAAASTPEKVEQNTADLPF